jgi:hypothetical protein
MDAKTLATEARKEAARLLKAADLIEGTKATRTYGRTARASEAATDNNAQPRPKRTLSAAARKRLSLAAKERWRKRKGEAKQ